MGTGSLTTDGAPWVPSPNTMCSFEPHTYSCALVPTAQPKKPDMDTSCAAGTPGTCATLRYMPATYTVHTTVGLSSSVTPPG